MKLLTRQDGLTPQRFGNWSILGLFTFVGLVVG